MNIVEIIKKAPKDHVYWNLMNGECSVVINEGECLPIKLIKECYSTIYLSEDGKFFRNTPDGKCLLFPSKDNHDWAAFERELDGKPEEKKPLFYSENESFNGSVEMVSIPDRPMMAAVICAGLLAGRCSESVDALAIKAVDYADMILDYTKEESNDKGAN